MLVITVHGSLSLSFLVLNDTQQQFTQLLYKYIYFMYIALDIQVEQCAEVWNHTFMCTYNYDMYVLLPVLTVQAKQPAVQGFSCTKE